MLEGKLIKLGAAFPVPAQGVGFLFLFIIVLFYRAYGLSILENPFMYLFFVVGLYLIISKKYLEVISLSNGTFKIRIGLGRFSHGSIKSLDKFEYGLLQQGSWNQLVKQGVGAFVINQGNYKESFLGLFLISKKNRSKILLCKGDRERIRNIIRGLIQPYGLPLYNGAKRKGNAIVIK